MLASAAGPVHAVDALGEIGSKLVRYAEELVGRFGRGVARAQGGEVLAETGTKKALVKTAEEAGEETAEKRPRRRVQRRSSTWARRTPPRRGPRQSESRGRRRRQKRSVNRVRRKPPRRRGSRARRKQQKKAESRAVNASTMQRNYVWPPKQE